MSDSSASAGSRHPLGHVVPLKFLVAVWGALMAFTVATVAVAQVDLGPLNLWVALGIATAKALLVAMFFMHLWWDRGFPAIILGTALVFVLLFIGMALMDSRQYQSDIEERMEAVEGGK